MLADNGCSCQFLGVVTHHQPLSAYCKSRDLSLTHQDINPHALAASRLTLDANQGGGGGGSSLIRGDLLGCLRSSSVDLLIFNPPCVPALFAAVSAIIRLSRDSDACAQIRAVV